MTIDRKLEAYLTKLEKILAPFPVSDRAEIVMEIKSHVLAAIERDPATNVESVLSALGEPDTVANRYLIERGLKPTKPSLSPIFKWLVLGFLGTFAIVCLFVAFVLFRFSPVLHVDDKNNKVTFFGGAIQVDGDNGGHIWMNDDSGKLKGFGTSEEGFRHVNEGEQIKVEFGSGKMEIKNAESDSFVWNCRGPHMEKGDASIKKSETPLELDLTQWLGSKCELQIPRNAHLLMKGQSGKVDIADPHFHVDLSLVNGKVDLSPDSESKYKYDVSVLNGKSERLESSTDPKAFEIKIQLTNGKFNKD